MQKTSFIHAICTRSRWINWRLLYVWTAPIFCGSLKNILDQHLTSVSCTGAWKQPKIYWKQRPVTSQRSAIRLVTATCHRSINYSGKIFQWRRLHTGWWKQKSHFSPASCIQFLLHLNTFWKQNLFRYVRYQSLALHYCALSFLFECSLSIFSYVFSNRRLILFC